MFINAMMSCLVKLHGDGDGKGGSGRPRMEGGRGGRIMRYTFKL